MMVAKQLVGISERALIARINRKLKPELETLRKARSASTAASVGDYFIVDLSRNAITSQRVDIEKFGRELGVLQKWEKLEEVE